MIPRLPGRVGSPRQFGDEVRQPAWSHADHLPCQGTPLGAGSGHPNSDEPNTSSHSHCGAAELAAQVGMSRSIIANVESGRKRIELSDVMLICDALDFDPKEAVERIVKHHRKMTR
jgi:DNA-binding Xre family transcriptional regulator